MGWKIKFNDEPINCQSLQIHCSITKWQPFCPNDYLPVTVIHELLPTETDNPYQLILNKLYRGSIIW
jgi:hypothetical protein